MDDGLEHYKSWSRLTFDYSSVLEKHTILRGTHGNSYDGCSGDKDKYSVRRSDGHGGIPAKKRPAIDEKAMHRGDSVLT